jgi:hypothetical protein
LKGEGVVVDEMAHVCVLRTFVWKSVRAAVANIAAMYEPFSRRG